MNIKYPGYMSDFAMQFIFTAPGCCILIILEIIHDWKRFYWLKQKRKNERKTLSVVLRCTPRGTIIPILDTGLNYKTIYKVVRAVKPPYTI